MPIISEVNDESLIYEALKEKLSLENAFAKDIKKFFLDIVKDQKDEYGVKTIHPQNFNRELEKILARNYQATIKKTLKNLDDDKVLKKLISKQELTRIKNQAELDALEFVKKRERVISKLLLDTTKKNLADSFTLVDKLIAEQGLQLTQKERLSLVMNAFEQKLQGRIQTIVTTEVQPVMQETKYSIAKGLENTVTRAGKNLQKRWIATLDKHTRPEHAAAHGQRVNLTGLFTVWGEQLLYPGDTSNGATPKNIMNCRCEVLYILI